MGKGLTRFVSFKGEIWWGTRCGDDGATVGKTRRERKGPWTGHLFATILFSDTFKAKTKLHRKEIAAGWLGGGERRFFMRFGDRKALNILRRGRPTMPLEELSFFANSKPVEGM